MIQASGSDSSYFIGKGESLVGRLLQSQRSHTDDIPQEVKIRRDPGCPVCGV